MRIYILSYGISDIVEGAIGRLRGRGYEVEVSGRVTDKKRIRGGIDRCEVVYVMGRDWRKLNKDKGVNYGIKYARGKGKRVVCNEGCI